MTRGYPILEWNPGLPIDYKENNRHTLVRDSYNEVESFNIIQNKDYITEYEEHEEYSEEEEQNDYSSDSYSELGNEVTTDHNINYQADTTVQDNITVDND